MNKVKRISHLGRILRTKVTNNYITNNQLPSTAAKDVHKVLLLFSIPFYNKKDNKIEDSTTSFIELVDKLTDNENYNEAYDLLKIAADKSNVELMWRLSKILFLKAEHTQDIEEAQKLINEANNILDSALEIDKKCAKVHKWKVIVMDAKLKFSGILFKLSNLHKLKHHLEAAIALDPTDVTCLYLLGMWHFELSHLTSFQKMLINFISNESINPSFEDGIKYFETVEKLKPRKYISNLYMLGKINFELKRYYYARYYLKIASSMESQNELDQKYSALARILAYKVQHYDHTYHDFNNGIK